MRTAGMVHGWLSGLVGPGTPDEAGPPDPPDHSLWWVERVVRRRHAWLVGIGGTAVVANEIALFGAELKDWDWLLVSGFAVLLVALYLPTLLPDKLEDAVTRLANRQVVTGGPALKDFLTVLHRDARRWALWGAGVAVVAIVGAFAWVQRFGPDSLMLVEAVAAVPVGLFAGRAAYYGTLCRRLVRAGYTVTPNPFHLDGAAGLRPESWLDERQTFMIMESRRLSAEHAAWPPGRCGPRPAVPRRRPSRGAAAPTLLRRRLKSPQPVAGQSGVT